MSRRENPIVDSNIITELLKDPIIIRIVTILDITSLSILELLEYDLSRKDVNHALDSGVIEVDKAASPIINITSTSDLLVAGDTYFYQFLNSKVRLTKLGSYLLDCIKGSQTEQEVLQRAREKFGLDFMPPESPNKFI